MRQLKVRIIENVEVARGFYRMRIASTYLAETIIPGQFVGVRCSDGLEPFLRRPFSVHRILKDSIKILYEVVGKGTRMLSRKKKGEYLDIIGPLGNGFTFNKRTPNPEPRTPILIAGGIGVAPLLALAERLVHSRQPIVHSKKKEYVLIGAKTRSHILCEKDFRKLGCEVLISTEDGSKSRKGMITGILNHLLSTMDRGLWAVYACGPVGMLKEVARIARGCRIPCQVSLEERMACGVGVCLGCPVKVKSVRNSGSPLPITHNPLPEYKMVCKDGPIFNAEEIEW